MSQLADLKVEKTRSSEEEWTFLTQKEIQTFLSSPLLRPDQKRAIAFAIFTGLRKGEQLSLHWVDVGNLDEPSPKATIRYGAVPSRKNGRKFMPPKGGVVKSIPLLPMAIDVLREIVDEEHGGVQPTEGLVFCQEGRKPFNSCYYFGWQPQKRRNGEKIKSIPLRVIGRHVRWQDLRHTTASHLIMGSWGEKWALEQVCAYLRHSDITVTMRYAHLADDFLAQKARTTICLTNGTPSSEAPHRVDVADESSSPILEG